MSRIFYGVEAPFPAYRTGAYYYSTSQAASASSATNGNNTLRLAPFVVRKAVSIDRLGAEVITIGEAGSKFRIGLYADDGQGRPGDLLVDAGQINGDSATVQERTVALNLTPGVYWTGGAVQSAATTQPAMRVTSAWHPDVPMSVTSSLPGAGAALVGLMLAATGALPANFGTTLSPAGAVPRIFFRVAA